MAVNSRIDRGEGGCQPYGAWKSRFLSINMAERRILGPGSEMPLWHRLLLIDGVCGGSRVIYHARFCGAKQMPSRVAVRSRSFHFRQGGRSVLQFVEPGGRNMQSRSRNTYVAVRRENGVQAMLQVRRIPPPGGDLENWTVRRTIKH